MPIHKLINLFWIVYVITQVVFLFNGITGRWDLSWFGICIPTIVFVFVGGFGIHYLVKEDII